MSDQPVPTTDEDLPPVEREDTGEQGGHDPGNTPIEQLLTAIDDDDDVFDQLAPDPAAGHVGPR